MEREEKLKSIRLLLVEDDEDFGVSLALELKNALSIRTSPFRLHIAGKPESKTFSLRCHVAMPFTEARLALKLWPFDLTGEER